MARLADMDAEDFVYRAEIVFAVGRRVRITSDEFNSRLELAELSERYIDSLTSTIDGAP